MTQLPPSPTPHSAAVAALPVRAIDQIGEAAASEVERVANTIETDAKGKADRLRLFASHLREQTRAAAEDVARLCSKNTDIFTTISNLELRLNTQETDIAVEDVKRLASTSFP